MYTDLLKDKFKYAVLDEWFFDIASLLINKLDFLIDGKVHKIIEVEVYYNSFDHKDPYVHCNALQANSESWYFHRINNSYKCGSFKGIDITFGENKSFGGILIRSLKINNEIINGPSLCVDYILNQTSFENIEKLDKKVKRFNIWDKKSPFYLRFSDKSLEVKIIKTPRVGLSLKRAIQNPTMKKFIMKDYRYTNEFKLKKGKVNTILTLIKNKIDFDDIKYITGSNLETVEKYFNILRNTNEINLTEFYNKNLDSINFCKLYKKLYLSELKIEI